MLRPDQVPVPATTQPAPAPNRTPKMSGNPFQPAQIPGMTVDHFLNGRQVRS